MTQRRIPAGLAAAGLGASLLLAAPASPVGAAVVTGTSVTVARGVTTSDSVVTSTRGRDRLLVGDSLSVGAARKMRRRGFAVHARVGRQFSTAPGILRSYRRVPRNVVIELGTNGTVRLGHCRKAVRAAGRGRRVFLVTNRVPRSWQRSNNRTLRACNRSFARSRVRIIDWHRASAGHPEWFGPDRVHLTRSGTRAFARLIDRAVDRHGK
jgi:hypothetical protein